MKKLLLICVLFFALKSYGQNNYILTSVNGVAYKATGVTGMTFEADGSIIFHGGYALTMLTQAELDARLDYDPLIPPPEILAKLSCGATSAWVAGGPNGGSINVALFDQKCGPVTFTPIPGTSDLKRGCMNTDSYLCSASIGSPNSGHPLTQD